MEGDEGNIWKKAASKIEIRNATPLIASCI